jgi:hypothetical protein
MCNIIDADFERFNEKGIVEKDEDGKVIHYLRLYEEDEVAMSDYAYEQNAELYCKHPDTDWHLMEVPKGKAIKCPPETELKVVFPSG